MSEKPNYRQRETGPKQSELAPSQTRARESVSFPDGVVLGYALVSVVAWFGGFVAVVVGKYGIAEFALLAWVGASICRELARIGEKLQRPPVEVSGLSDLDASTYRRRDAFSQRVALLSLMSNAQDPEVRIRAKRELDWMDKDLAE